MVVGVAKPLRWTRHAAASLVDREIDREEATATIMSPDAVAPADAGRLVLMRRYHDEVLHPNVARYLKETRCP